MRAQGGRLVAHTALMNRALAVAVAVVGDLGHRAVHRELREVRATEPDQLGVEIREFRAWSRGSLVKSMPGTTLAGVEGYLLGLGKEVVRVAVERHLPTGCTGTNSSGKILVASSRSKSNGTRPPRGAAGHPTHIRGRRRLMASQRSRR